MWIIYKLLNCCGRVNYIFQFPAHCNRIYFVYSAPCFPVKQRLSFIDEHQKREMRHLYPWQIFMNLFNENYKQPNKSNGPVQIYVNRYLEINTCFYVQNLLFGNNNPWW